MPDLLGFKWERNLDGYDIVRVHLSPKKRREYDKFFKDTPDIGLFTGHYLLPRGRQSIRYNPLQDCPGLYMEFANIEPTLEGMKSFADKYGLLFFGAPQELKKTVIWPLRPKTNPLFNLEALQLTLYPWFRERSMMRDAINAYADLKNDGKNAERTTEGLLEIVNSWWDGYGSMERYMASNELSPMLHPTTEVGKFTFTIEPGDLAYAMKLQFMQSISNNATIGTCVQCNNWFEISPGSGRPDKSYCSDACRMRAYRKRKTEKEHNG